jgi:hypothetical protein
MICFLSDISHRIGTFDSVTYTILIFTAENQHNERLLPVFEQFLYPENRGLGAKLSHHQTIAP